MEPLSILAEVPGVLGSVLFDAQGKLLGTSLPAGHDAQAVSQVCARLAEDHFFQEWLKGAAATYELKFSDGLVVVRRAGEGWVLVLCSRECNPQLVAMSLTQVVHRLKRARAEAAAPVPPVAPGPLAGPVAGPAGKRQLLVAVVREALGPVGQPAVDLLERVPDTPERLAAAVVDVHTLARALAGPEQAEALVQRLRWLL